MAHRAVKRLIKDKADRERYIRFSDGCDIYQCSLNTLRKMAEAAGARVTYPGTRSVRIDTEVLDDYIARNQ